jgi:hypothetical protein
VPHCVDFVVAKARQAISGGTYRTKELLGRRLGLNLVDVKPLSHMCEFQPPPFSRFIGKDSFQVTCTSKQGTRKELVCTMPCSCNSTVGTGIYFVHTAAFLMYDWVRR